METKIYFLPGDEVTVKQKLDYVPIMYVVRKSTKIKINSSDPATFQGMLCRWFTIDGLIQEAVFNTKDLLKC